MIFVPEYTDPAPCPRKVPFSSLPESVRAYWDARATTPLPMSRVRPAVRSTTRGAPDGGRIGIDWDAVEGLGTLSDEIIAARIGVCVSTARSARIRRQKH
jgi:hypothetical protein